MNRKLLDLLLFSEKRKNLIMLLRDGPRNLTEIKQMLDVTSPGIIPQIRMLEHRNIIIREGKSYLLTDIGRLLSNYLFPLFKVISIVEENEQYFHTHNISEIPENLLKRFHELGNCRVDKLDLQSVYEPHTLFLQKLSESNIIKGMTPVFRPSWPDLFLQLTQSGKKVSLILTPEAYKKVMTECANSIEEFINLDNTEFYISESEFKFSMIVTNCYFSITLFLKDGSYDSLRNLVSLDSSAISWGEDLFEYQLNNSHKI